MRIFERIACWLIQKGFSRAPDFVIGGNDNPYMLRWWLTPWSGKYGTVENKTLWQWLVTQLPGVYLHFIVRSDDDRALHDHPWWNISVILVGSYIEHTIDAGGVNRRVLRKPGSVVFRRAAAAHRLEIGPVPCWSLFITGPRRREWGFHCPNGWVNWRKFTNPDDGGATIGRGCT